MAELRLQSRPWILLPDRATTSSASSRTIVVSLNSVFRSLPEMLSICLVYRSLMLSVLCLFVDVIAISYALDLDQVAKMGQPKSTDKSM